MAKASTKTTPSFMCEIALIVSPREEGVLLKRLEAGRQMYNACLGEAMRRVGRICQSNKAFQKLFGKSVGKRAPGIFVSHLKSKAERAGGKVIEILTYNTKLSQTCHCGRVKKKPLKERVHSCECGVVAQRDLYCALLAKHTQPDTFVLQVSQLVKDWQSAELRWQAAWRTATDTQPATGGMRPSCFGRCPETERVAAEVFKKTSESQDAVAVKRELGRGCSVKEPPCF